MGIRIRIKETHEVLPKDEVFEEGCRALVFDNSKPFGSATRESSPAKPLQSVPNPPVKPIDRPTATDDAERRAARARHEAEVTELRNALGRHETEANELRNTLGRHEAEVNELRNALGRREDEVAELRLEVTRQQAEVTTLQEAPDPRADEVASLREAIGRHEGQLTDLAARHEVEFAETRGALAESREALAETLRALTHSEHEVALLQESLATIEAEAETQRQSVHARESDAAGLTERIAQLQDAGRRATEAHRQSLTEAKGRHEALSAELGAALEREESYRIEAHNLRSTHQELVAHSESEIARLGQALSRCEAELEELLTARLDRDNEIDTLRGELKRQELGAGQLVDELRQALRESEAARASETESFSNARSDLVASTDAQIARLTESLSHREFEMGQLHQTRVDRDQQIVALREELVQQEIAADQRAEELRQALIESEARRAADAEEFINVFAQRDTDISA